MKRLIQTAIASFLALTLVYIPVFAQPITPVKPQKQTETGPAIPQVDKLNLKKIEPIAPPQLAEIAPVAPIATPAPEPAPAPAQAQSAPTGGCVSGVTVANYAENALIQRESTGNSCAENAGGCFGLLQACPGGELKATCGGDVACQLDWFTRIKLPTYGTWENAWYMDNTRCGSPQGCWW